MPKRKTEPQPVEQPAPAEINGLTPSQELAAALLEAIKQSQAQQTPFIKKNATNKPHGGPWAPKPGETKPKLKRRIYHHGMLMGDPKEPTNRFTSEEINLLNQLKPGIYCNGFVRVNRLRNKGLDIDYPVRTNSQKLRLVGEFGIKSFAELIQRCLDEASKPKSVVAEEDE
jgi:hypothetical protein